MGPGTLGATSGGSGTTGDRAGSDRTSFVSATTLGLGLGSSPTVCSLNTYSIDEAGLDRTSFLRSIAAAVVLLQQWTGHDRLPSAARKAGCFWSWCGHTSK